MNRLPMDMEARLKAAAVGAIDYAAETDANKVTVAWCGLALADDLVAIGGLMHSLGARLSMISAAQPPAPEAEEDDEDEDEAEEGAEAAEPDEKPVPLTFGGTPLDGTSYEIDYHFDLGGDTLTVIVYVPAGGSVASLTRLFRTASWPEREMMENYAIGIKDHPDPRRLFIDPSIDPAVLERLIPYSTLVNAASTKSLWDRVLAGKGGKA